MYFGGWNVRSCFHYYKQQLIIKQLKKYKLQVTALCETGIYDSGTKSLGDFTMIYSGLPKLNRTKAAHGVAICLDKIATKIWKLSGAEWEAVNERIIKIRMHCAPINVTYVAVYAPVNPNNKVMAEASDVFYSKLQETIDRVPKGDMIVLMGDFNARVGKQEHLSAPQTVGPYPVDVKNDNGIRLVEFCLTNNIVISNTFFQHKLIHQTSWMHPGNKQWHMLDYTLINKKFRSSIEDVRVYRKAAGSIGTDHHLMRSKFKLHLKSRVKKIQQNYLRLDRSKLEDVSVIEHFRDDLQQKFEDTKNDKININEKYSTFVQCIKEVAKTHVKLDNDSNNKRKEWLTNEILEAVEKKSSAYLMWQNHRDTPNEKKYKKNYTRYRKLVKLMIDKRKVEYWDGVSKEIETAITNHDPATAYAMIRRLKGGKQEIENSPIQNKFGKLLNNSMDKLDRWREYFSELLNVKSVIDPQIMEYISSPSLSTTEQERQEKPPTLEEISQALKQMKNGKAPGNDDISADLLKAGGLPVLRRLHEIFVDIWLNEEIVENWTLAILIRLFKNKGDKKQCDNYRGISLLVVVSKLFTRIILNRIQKLIDQQLLEQQAGFRSNRSTIDQIFIIKMIMEKSREFNKSLFMCFIDIQKAYDSVNRDLLWRICKHYGLTDKIIRLLKLTYKNTRAKVRINGELSESFVIENGVMQGGIPSPVLFNILFDFIIRKVLEEASVTGIKLAYGGNDFYHGSREKYEEFDVLTLMYADDLVALCNTINDLETFIHIFENVTQRYGLTMNVKKTCIMSLQQFKQDASGKILKTQEVDQPDVDITIRDKKIETTDSFCYLGCLLSRDQRLVKEIENRLTKATTAFYMLRNIIWSRKKISVDAKLRIFRACVLPVLLYGSEVWTLTMAQENRINMFYMKCLRTILGLNLGDRVSNLKILELSGQPPIENIMRRNRLRWFGHINRMDYDNNQVSLMKKVMFSYFPAIKRPTNVGIRKRWENKIMEDIEKCGIKNWRRNTKYRDKWRKLINQNVQVNPVHLNINNIITKYKEDANKRRSQESTVKHSLEQPKVTEILVKESNNLYTCPKCSRCFKSQGITGHVKACAKEWCKRHKIKLK